MTTPRISSTSTAWRRQLRGWFGVLLMVVSLLGGYRVATRMTEETSSEEVSQVEAYAHRQSEGGSPKRRSRTSADTWISASAPTANASVSRPAGRLIGESPVNGHQMANGLRAPLRC